MAGLHSEKTQGYRFRVMTAFREGVLEFELFLHELGKLDVLVATDVTSRGLDIPGITHVIQYDMPNKIETYIHRVGRTGRSGEQGLATALLTYHCKCAKDLKQLLKMTKQEVPLQLRDVRLFGHTVMVTELGDRVLTSGEELPETKEVGS